MPIREIHWEITNKCNLRCKHCLPMSGSARPDELTNEEAFVAMETFRAAGASKIFFTGGEPFIQKDFLGLLERAVALGMRVSVITNATMLTSATLECLKHLGVDLGVSLDGANAATNDAIRGQGSFKQALEALNRCKKSGVSTTLYVTVTGKNVDQLDDFAQLAKDHECAAVHFNQVTIAGRALSFVDELALSVDQQQRLPELVAETTRVIFGEELSATDERCWVDGVTVYMSADGNLYLCSEVFQRRPDLSIGNIRSFSFKAWAEQQNVSSFANDGDKCCYGVRASEHSVFVGNVGAECIFAPRKWSIDTLSKLYDVLGELYQDIGQDCRDCRDPDCLGYVWLLKKEADRLYEQGVALVQVNDGPTFIHSFPMTSEGRPDLSTRYPPCSQLCTDSRRCRIYQDRPLACRLYPLGPETKADGTVVWALHLDCLHVERMEKRGMLPQFERRALSILNSLSPQLLGEIAETYREVDALCAFPDGENKYRSLQPVK
ncbi:MAG TPA: hypothetical protein DEP63_00170 [Candidatus Magasanikbacteria bacterium]|nr:hypothetical protein [Candidatus Magasanikbacteria bacterium]HCC13154.1 hypothetical protein [Candidatus Magasanikbacteria bacterium]